jgi:hypothetical protein
MTIEPGLGAGAVVGWTGPGVAVITFSTTLVCSTTLVSTTFTGGCVGAAVGVAHAATFTAKASNAMSMNTFLNISFFSFCEMDFIEYQA